MFMFLDTSLTCNIGSVAICLARFGATLSNVGVGAHTCHTRPLHGTQTRDEDSVAVDASIEESGLVFHMREDLYSMFHFKG